MTRNTSSLAAVVCTSALVLGVASCGNAKSHQQTLTYTEGPEEAAVFGFVDASPKTHVGKEGPERVSPGDQVSFGEDLFDSSKKKVGRLDGVCVVTRPGTFATGGAQCTGTAAVPGGTLVISTNSLAENVSGPIIGGTGIYENAAGIFTDRHPAEGQPAVTTFRVTTPEK